MRYHVTRVLPSILMVMLVALGVASCGADTTAPNDVDLTGSWLSTDKNIRFSIDVSGTPDSLAADWQFRGQGEGSCEGTGTLQHLESNVALQMRSGDFCSVTFQGAIIDANTVKGLLDGTVTNVGTESRQTGTLLIELHRQ